MSNPQVAIYIPQVVTVELIFPLNDGDDASERCA